MVETIKLTFTYIIALVVVLGGGYMLFATRGEAGADNLQLVVSGFIGAALAFVFGGEIQTRTARQQERALLTGPATSTTTYVNGTGAVTPPTDTETA